MLTQILFVSRISPLTTDLDIRSIVASSEIHNRRNDVTGALIRSGRCFAMVLEGRKRPVDQTMQRIQRDQRHCDIRVISKKNITLRQFARWPMGRLCRDDIELAIEKLLDATQGVGMGSQALTKFLLEGDE